MNGRLTFNEFDALKNWLRVLENVGNNSLMEGGPVSGYGKELIKIFGATTSHIAENTDRIKTIREKLQNITGD